MNPRAPLATGSTDMALGNGLPIFLTPVPYFFLSPYPIFFYPTLSLQIAMIGTGWQVLLVGGHAGLWIFGDACDACSHWTPTSVYRLWL